MFEINNVFYVVGENGILTLNSEFHKNSSNEEYCLYATCQVGNNIFVISFDYYDNVETRLFNPIKKQWTDANINTKRENFAVVYYLNKVWIIGGEQHDDDGNDKAVNTVEVYDPVAKNQVLAPIKMIQARDCHRVIVYKKKLFIFGGHGKDNELLNTVEMFSPENQKFVLMTPMKVARSYFACCRVGNLVYVIGGWIPGGVYTKSVEIYNLDNDTWTDGIDLPDGGIRGSCACAVNNKL